MRDISLPPYRPPVPRDVGAYLRAFDAYLAAPLAQRDGQPATAKAHALDKVLEARGIVPEGAPYYNTNVA